MLASGQSMNAKNHNSAGETSARKVRRRCRALRRWLSAAAAKADNAGDGASEVSMVFAAAWGQRAAERARPQAETRQDDYLLAAYRAVRSARILSAFTPRPKASWE